MTNGEGPAVWVVNHRWGERRFYFEDEDDDEYEDDVFSAARWSLIQETAKGPRWVRKEPSSGCVLLGCVRLR
jgi:hypothetical protein